MTIVLAALPMQNQVSTDISADITSARPMAYEIRATAGPTPTSSAPPDLTAISLAPPDPAPPQPKPEPDEAAPEEFMPDGLMLNELIPDEPVPIEPAPIEPAPIEPAVTAVLPPTGGMALAGTFTAKVMTWDASAAALRLSHQEAARHLAEAGLKSSSTGRCTDRRRRSCTSLETIRYGTLMQLIDLKRTTGCDITVTGGTETGHASGRYSHGNGFKVDIAHNKCIDAYIRGKFRRWKTREDGSALYRPSSEPGMPSAPAVYADESTHWDILYL